MPAKRLSNSEAIQRCINALPKLQKSYMFSDVTIDKLYDFSNANIELKKYNTSSRIYISNIYCKRDSYYFKQLFSSIEKGFLYMKFKILTDSIILETCKKTLPELQKKYKYGDITELYDFSNVIIKRYTKKQHIYITNIYCDRDKFYFEQSYDTLTRFQLYKNFITPPDSIFLKKCNDALNNFDYRGDIKKLYDFSNATVEIKKHDSGSYISINNIYREIDDSHFSQEYYSIIYNHRIHSWRFKETNSEIIQKCIDSLYGLQKSYKFSDVTIDKLYDFSNARVELKYGNKPCNNAIIITNIYCDRDKFYFEQPYRSILNYSVFIAFTRTPDSIILENCKTYARNISRYDFSNAIIRRMNRRILIDNVYCKKCKEYINNRDYNCIMHWPNNVCNCDFNTGNCELYLIKFTSDFDQDFLKIGISINFKKRLYHFYPYNIKILNTIKFENYDEMYQCELELHAKFRPNYQFFPRLVFGGSKECYTMDLLNNPELRSIFELDGSEKIEYYDSNFDITLKLAV